MKNQTLVIILWISTLSALAIVIIPYVSKFSNLDISNSPENWGPFGDYIGGILNPIIGILNLIVLTYLSVNLVKEENERNKFTLQELAKPYGEFDFTKKLNSLSIKFLNIGLGPLIINEIIITSPNGRQYNDFKKILEDFHNSSEGRDYQSLNYEFHTFGLSNNHAAIGKDTSILLFNCENISPIEYSEKLIVSLKKFMSKYKIQIKYSDIYDRKFQTHIETIFHN
ncbi:hypothetical protein [uncultured Chryseobacterium sp.]|jgi:hypothetical protein|uniref:hypothetical protein n=1 Tax=uncultured Chryseobacterium sp. TaxID=259322 RepID=UPI002639FA66|nr:hypothetical protein [uncultured Chryseobacterium sp.]